MDPEGIGTRSSPGKLDSNEMKSGARRIALRTSLMYWVLAALWILVSDRILSSLVQDPKILSNMQSFKGWAFVTVTAALLFLGLHAQLKRWRHVVEEREREVQKRLELESQFSRLAAASPGAIYSYCLNQDGSSSFPYASPNFKEMFGLDPAELVADSQPAFDLIHPEDLYNVKSSVMDSAKVLKPWHAAFRIVHPTRGELWVEGHSVPFQAENGAVVWHGFFHDITSRMKAEETRQNLENQLAQAQKMEAMGTLAGGIAHDFNNILSAILGNAELARLDRSNPDNLQLSLDEITKAGNRAKNLVRQILTFSRQQSEQRAPVSLESLIDECISLLQATLPASVTLTREIASGLPKILADSTQLHQVLVNLITNAWHALPEEKGHIHICLSLLESGRKRPSSLPDLLDVPYLLLSVQDDGQGMDTSTQRRIFEPFFTTKPPGKGTGLGLSVVHGIMKSHGGTIEVNSQPGHGSTFKLYFPVCAEQKPAVAKAGDRFPTNAFDRS